MGNSKWSLYKENGRWVVRRWESGKYKRVPLKKYAHLRDSDEEMRRFVSRENIPFTLAEAVAFKHAFINDFLLAEYRQERVSQVSSKKNALCQYNYLVSYALNYFIGELGLADPRRWFAVTKSKWAQYLLDKRLSASTLRKIVQELNTFIEFLAVKYPTEFVAIKFKPFSKQKLKTLAERRRLDKGYDRYVRLQEWRKLRRRLPDDIKAAVCLAYYFGLRRSETLGMRLGDVRKEFLRVERQQLELGKFDILKGKKNRKTPYWYGRPGLAYALIKRVVPMSPDTLSERFAGLKSGYYLHDLRATFITNALRDHSPRETQLAIGHENIATTMRYAQDHRDFGDDIWSPDAA